MADLSMLTGGPPGKSLADVPSRKSDPRKHPDNLHEQLQAIPMPKADLRVSDPTSSMRDYAAPPVLMVTVGVRQIWFGVKD